MSDLRTQSKESFNNKQGYGTELCYLNLSLKTNSGDVCRRILKTQSVSGGTSRASIERSV